MSAYLLVHDFLDKVNQGPQAKQNGESEVSSEAGDIGPESVAGTIRNMVI